MWQAVQAGTNLQFLNLISKNQIQNACWAVPKPLVFCIRWMQAAHFCKMLFNLSADACGIGTFCTDGFPEAENSAMQHIRDCAILDLHPGTELTKVFSLLDKASVPRGKGAIVCIRRLAFVPPYFVFCSISFRCGGLSIERNQKPLAPKITLVATHHDRQKQVEVKRSSCVNPHEIRLFSGCPYAVVK